MNKQCLLKVVFVFYDSLVTIILSLITRVILNIIHNLSFGSDYEGNYLRMSWAALVDITFVVFFMDLNICDFDMYPMMGNH